jgi:hypothetical protein
MHLVLPISIGNINLSLKFTRNRGFKDDFVKILCVWHILYLRINVSM